MRLPLLSSLFCVCFAGPALAAPCGNTSAGFAAWKAAFAHEARQAGVKKPGLQALQTAQYASRTISADRNQKSFRYTLEKFMEIRGSTTIVAQGRKRKARNPEFYAALEKKYGVPAGVLIAIHGMALGSSLVFCAAHFTFFFSDYLVMGGYTI